MAARNMYAFFVVEKLSNYQSSYEIAEKIETVSYSSLTILVSVG